MAASKLSALATVVVFVGLGVGAAWAEDGAAVVAKRQAVMKEQGKDMKAVKDFIDGKGELAGAQAGAADLHKTMAEIPGLFPKDTGLDQVPKSEAKAVIWSDWDKFLAARKNAADKADVLAAAVTGGDKASITAAFGDLGKNGCGGCHETFREKKS